MPHIVLTEEQARILRQSTLSIELHDEQGRLIARVPPPTEEEILERIQWNRSEALPRYPGRDVHARLQRLDEIGQQEKLDEARARELLHRMRGGEGG